MRILLPLLLLAGLDAAEVGRRDVLLAVEQGDGSFTYDLHAPVGDFTGNDAFDRFLTTRLGGRWAISSAGGAVAPLLGIDAIATDAAMPGGTLRGVGAGLTAGATWAWAEGWAMDGEGLIGAQLATLTLPTGSSGALVASGPLLSSGLRGRILWGPSRRWSLALEGGWRAWSADLDGDAGRSISLDGGGWLVGLALAWRPSARPGGIE